MKDLTHIIEACERKAERYQETIDQKVLMSHNYIITAGDLKTIGKDKDSIAVAWMVDYPSQWTEESADFILQNVRITGLDGKIMPLKKVLWKDWYRAELATLRESIEFIKLMQADSQA
jgi:hypothetical protein